MHSTKHCFHVSFPGAHHFPGTGSPCLRWSWQRYLRPTSGLTVRACWDGGQQWATGMASPLTSGPPSFLLALFARTRVHCSASEQGNGWIKETELRWERTSLVLTQCIFAFRRGCCHTSGARSGCGDVTIRSASGEARAAASWGLEAAAGLIRGRFLAGEAGSLPGTRGPASSFAWYRRALRATESPADCGSPGRGDAFVKVGKEGSEERARDCLQETAFFPYVTSGGSLDDEAMQNLV